MSSCRRLFALIGFLSLATTALFAQGQKRPPSGADYWFRIEREMGLQTRYSVDMEIQAMGMAMSSKTYRLDDLTRSETTLPFMNLAMVTLQLKENGKPVSYTLFPDKKKYCLNEEAQAAAEKSPAYKVTDAGTEMYEGAACKKRRITVTTDDGQSQDMDMLFSPAQKNMPVKMTATVKAAPEPGEPPMEITSVVLFKNYRFAAPAASLFTIPKDYTRAASMQEVMMSGLGGTMPPPSGPAAAGAGAQDVNALLRQAQQDAAREAAAEAAAEAAEAQQENRNKAAGENLQQNIRALRGLFGK